MALLQTLKSLVNQRISAAAEEIFGIIGRILTEYEDEAFHIKQETDRQRRLLDMVLQPIVKLHRADSIHLLVCKEEVFTEQQERTSSLVQEHPEPPQIKDEQEEITSSLIKEEPESLQIKEEHDELRQRSDEDGGSTEILLSVKHEDDDENIQTEPIASTSSKHMETQADVEDCGSSQPTSDDQLLSSHCSESDITEDSDEWDETMNDQPGLSTLTSHNTQHMGGNSLSLSNTLLHDSMLKSPKQSHSTRSHIGKTCFSCADCGKMFNRKGTLKTHTMIHSGERPFVCTVCGKGCSQKGSLKLLMRTHTGENPFTCTVCGTGFSRKDNLKSHMINHTGEKPFTCTVCGKGFSQNGALKVHMRSHTGEKPFTCTVCGKGFSQNGDLKVHMRTHTGDRPFTCTVCGKGLVRTADLKIHMRTHTGEKPFTCTVCEKGFSQNRYLKTHMKTCHKEEKAVK